MTTEEYISPADEKEQKTVFILKPLSKKFIMSMSMKCTDIVNGKPVYSPDKAADRCFDYLKAGISEIKKGNEVIKEITDEVIENLDFPVIMDLFGKIMSSIGLKGEEKKN